VSLPRERRVASRERRRRSVVRHLSRTIDAVGARRDAVEQLTVASDALAIARYLAPFSERTPLAYWAMMVAVFAALVVIGIAAARQAREAMRMKPAVALRA